MRSILLALALTLAACGGGDDAPMPELREGTVRVQIAMDVTSPGPIKLGTNEVHVAFPSAPEAELVSASALMPAHGHGTRPTTVEKTADGYRVANLILYMSGRWELRLEVRAGGRADEAWVTVDVP